MSLIIELTGSAYSNLIKAPTALPKAWQGFKEHPEKHITDIATAFLSVPAYYTLRAPMPLIIKALTLAPMALVLGLAGLIEHLATSKSA